jgi:purine nucleosidase/ribosylpyrimidine nucleosidase
MIKKVILDCDPGTDDAIAMMLALFSPDLDVLGISVVNGNRIVEKTIENALRVVQFLESKVPVYRGCEHPLVCNLIPERKPGLPRITRNDSHGDYLNLPAARIKHQPEHAVFWLVDTLMKSDGDISVAAVGPLTNIAMALRIEPRLEDKIKELVIMGGGHTGCNSTGSAEFNFWADPEAAKIVMDTKIPKVILPLDATWRACITDQECDELIKLGTPAAIKAAEMVKLRIANLKVEDVSANNYNLRHTENTVSSKLLYRYENNMAPIHDALAVAYLIDPSVAEELVDANVDIDISGGLCDGRMVADVHNTKKLKDRVTCKVALNSSSKRFVELLFENLAKTKVTQ